MWMEWRIIINLTWCKISDDHFETGSEINSLSRHQVTQKSQIFFHHSLTAAEPWQLLHGETLLALTHSEYDRTALFIIWHSASLTKTTYINCSWSLPSWVTQVLNSCNQLMIWASYNEIHTWERNHTFQDSITNHLRVMNEHFQTSFWFRSFR